jgi:pantoate--beta-alanine ligase
LRRALLAARARWEGGETDADRLRDTVFEVLTHEPLVDVEYVSIADGTTLAELKTLDRPALASLAVRFGTTRLIDNEILEATTGTARAGSV